MDHSKVEGIFKDTSSDGKCIQQQVDKDGMTKKLNQYFENRKVLLQNVAEVKRHIHHEIDSLIGVLKEREIQLCLEVDQKCLDAEVSCFDRLNLIRVEDELHPSSSSPFSFQGEENEALMNATPFQETGFAFRSEFHFINNELAEYGWLTVDGKAFNIPMFPRRKLQEQVQYLPKLITRGSPKSKQTIARGTPESEDSFEVIDPVEVPPLETLISLQTEVKGNMTKPPTTQATAKSKLIPNFSFWKKGGPKTEERPFNFFNQAGVNANVATSPMIPTTAKSEPFKVDPVVILVKGKLLYGLLVHIRHEYSIEVVNNIRGLIQDVIDGTVQPDEILTKELGCDASYHLNILHSIFKNYLPYIRHQLITKELTLMGIHPPPPGVFTLPVPRSPRFQQKQDEDDGIEVISKDETDEDSTSMDSHSTTTSKTLPFRDWMTAAQLKSLKPQKKCQPEEKVENCQVKLPSCQLTTTTKCLQFLSDSPSLRDELSECPDLIPKEEEKPSPSSLLISSFEEYLTKDNRETWLTPRSCDDNSKCLPCKDSTNIVAHLKNSPEKWLSTRGNLDKWLSSQAKSEKIATNNDGVKNCLDSCIRKAENLVHPRPMKFDEWVASEGNLCSKENPVSSLKDLIHSYVRDSESHFPPPRPIKFDGWVASESNLCSKEIPVSNLFSTSNSFSRES